MNKQKAIAVFDIGKTNKKIILFDSNLNIIYTLEKSFKTTVDPENFECDDITLIEDWMLTGLSELISKTGYDVIAVNFCTYGASLVFLDEKGQRLTPLYNYLKEVPLTIQQKLFQNYGGQEEFCRKTASPAYGQLLNSGIQILWMKEMHAEIFKKVRYILHFPQYLSYLLTGKVFSEPTSIGCHTFMWDFDNNCYHHWLADHKILLPEPMLDSHTESIEYCGKNLLAGVGIHDSSSSLIPFMLGTKDKFLLISTGTWCINMNPFNMHPFTVEHLRNDCMNYLSVDRLPVKSSRFFLGYIHDINVKRLTDYFHVGENDYRCVKADDSLIKKLIKQGEGNRIFFRNGIPGGYLDSDADLSQFSKFEEAYHHLMFDLAVMNNKYIKLILSPDDEARHFYICGGFADNEIFVKLMATFFPDNEIYTSEVKNSSALGAALAIADAFGKRSEPLINLNLRKWGSII